MKKDKTYDQYKDDAKVHHDSIMAKYGAPDGAKPPRDKDHVPVASDKHYRRYAFTLKRRLEQWPTSNRKYPKGGSGG